MGKRTYTEDEMASLLERAARLQAQAAKQAERKAGLSLDELEDIAAEAGLDPIHLRQAAAEMFDAGIDISHRKVSTSASHIYVDQWVVADLTDEAWEEIEAELRHRYDTDLGQMMSGGVPTAMGYGRGHASQVGRRREWKHMSMSGVETRVMIQPRGESLQVKLSQRVGWASTTAESFMYGIILAALAALTTGAIVKSALIGFVTLAAAMAVAVPLIYWADSAWRKKKHAALEELADDLAGILSSYAPEKKVHMTYEDQAETEPAKTESRIDQGLLDGAEYEEEKKKSGRQRERS